MLYSPRLLPPNVAECMWDVCFPARYRNNQQAQSNRVDRVLPSLGEWPQGDGEVEHKGPPVHEPSRQGVPGVPCLLNQPVDIVTISELTS